MPDARLAHHPSHPHPSHGQPPYPSPYPPAQHGPPYHHSSRHVSNGPPPPVVVGGHGGHPGHGHPMAAPPDPIGPPPGQQMGNGHGPHHPPPPPSSVGPPMSAAARAGKEKQESVLSQLASANENTWMLIGAVAEQMQDQDRAMAAFENALRHNPNSILGLNAVASIARSRDNFDKAIEYFQRILNIKQDNGEVWGSMGHCLLMKDDLPKAYTAYQQALYHLPNPKEPKLWYGIGILYDRYGSFEHAEEAFSSVLKMDPNFEKANEIYFRLGIIYKHQRKYQASLECFKYILQDPPRPLTSWDIWFQLGHVYEQDRDYENARDAYMRVLAHQPDHAKVLQQLGWLHHQPGAPFADQEKAVQYLTKSLETDGTDAQSWYLLGRAFMAGQRYNKAYEAYQQAVYRDGRNPTFWCSIGVLYFQINQYRDALDAYSRAIRLNPYISEVWYNLGSLYESCNNQITDAIDAYTRAADLDPTNGTIKQRLGMLQNAGGSNQNLPPAPGPVDVHPSQYTAQPQGPYPPGGSPGASPRPIQAPPAGPEVDGPNGRALPPPPPGGDLGRIHSPGPFRGGVAPPPLQHVDESRGAMSRHAPLAPMEMEGAREQRPEAHRFEPDARRHASPGSPRRREAYPPHPGYPGYGRDGRDGREGRDGRDREREEWERRNSRPGPGPSPRMHERMPQPPGRQPSPRHPAEYGYGYPPDPRAGYPHDRRDPSNGANGAHYGPPGAGTPRHPSGTYDDPRAPSPAPSSIASVGGTRRKREEEQPRSVKKEKTVSKKNSGDKKTSLKVTLRTGGGENPSPKDDVSPPVLTSTPREIPAPPAPSRAVDEDYDEGAADALMTLHGDRPPSVVPRQEESPPTVTGNKRAASPTSPGNSKKARPEAVARLSAASVPGRNGSASPAKRQVIEVLNTPSISSPMPRPTSAVAGEKDAEVSAGDKPAEVPNSDAAAVVGDVPQPEAPAQATEATKPAPVESMRPVETAPTEAKQADGDVEMKDDSAPAPGDVAAPVAAAEQEKKAEEVPVEAPATAAVGDSSDISRAPAQAAVEQAAPAPSSEAVAQPTTESASQPEPAVEGTPAAPAAVATESAAAEPVSSEAAPTTAPAPAAQSDGDVVMGDASTTAAPPLQESTATEPVQPTETAPAEPTKIDEVKETEIEMPSEAEKAPETEQPAKATEKPVEEAEVEEGQV